jgi:hypothetical protein
MKRTILGALAALAVSASAFALTAAAEGDQHPSPADRMERWAADRETILDAKLAGMKAGLQLTLDQEKLWGAFESSVKDAVKARTDAMQQVMQAREHGEHMSPIDRLDVMAERLSQGATDIKKIAAAARPLYASLDDSQKHKFGMLGRMLMPERARFVADMAHHHAGPRDDDGAE